jgi:hypothetical protein
MIPTPGRVPGGIALFDTPVVPAGRIQGCLAGVLVHEELGRAVDVEVGGH